MPVMGRKPKPEGQKRTRHPLQHEFVDVPDVPFAGGPELPGKPSRATAEWWDAVSTMPHCALWTPSDWRFAMDTARVAAKFYGTGEMKYATELRNREKVLGTTLDYRRDLRIRYVSPDTQTLEADASVTAIADYRAALESG